MSAKASFSFRTGASAFLDTARGPAISCGPRSPGDQARVSTVLGRFERRHHPGPGGSFNENRIRIFAAGISGPSGEGGSPVGLGGTCRLSGSAGRRSVRRSEKNAGRDLRPGNPGRRRSRDLQEHPSGGRGNRLSGIFLDHGGREGFRRRCNLAGARFVADGRCVSSPGAHPPGSRLFRLRQILPEKRRQYPLRHFSGRAQTGHVDLPPRPSLSRRYLRWPKAARRSASASRPT